jgi:hypothetical protein
MKTETEPRTIAFRADGPLVAAVDAIAEPSGNLWNLATNAVTGLAGLPVAKKLFA